MEFNLSPEDHRKVVDWLKSHDPASDLKTDLIRARTESPWLMVILHGLGDSMEGYRDIPNALRIPHLNYLLVNAPDPYYGGFSWYDIAGDSAPGVLRSRNLLGQLLDSIRPRFPKDKTFLFGFSQGCLMTLETGLRYPQKLAGLIGISGYVHDAPALINDLSPTARQTPILWTHGLRDPLIPIAKVKPQMETLKDAGLNITWREFLKEHTIHPQEIEVIRDFILKSAPLA
jgi:phospholipase/carboxylesterase